GGRAPFAGVGRQRVEGGGHGNPCGGGEGAGREGLEVDGAEEGEGPKAVEREFLTTGGGGLHHCRMNRRHRVTRHKCPPGYIYNRQTWAPPAGPFRARGDTHFFVARSGASRARRRKRRRGRAA